MSKRFSSVVISRDKLRDYCLSEVHPRGRHKARVFKSRLGIGADEAETLAVALHQAVLERSDTVVFGEADTYGQRFILDLPLTTETGSATVRSAWIVRKGEDVLRFVTCFVL